MSAPNLNAPVASAALAPAPVQTITPRQAAMARRVAPAAGLTAAHADMLVFMSQSHGAGFDQLMQYAESVGIKRDQVSYIAFALAAFYLVFGSAARLFCNLIGFGYPMYASVKAIRTKETDDDTVWLIYWTCFAVLCLVDFFSEAIFSFFPFYYIFKAIFLVYLYLPQTGGAAMFYEVVVDPLVVFLDRNIEKFNKKD
ncbi:unnamed protein product [Caenorhabditis sp. 36 PRJEB53466]|nr:unnamed protein product [Caenorhabditis sp. 36 PRJEB53466]